ncbi:isochorismate synthase [Rhodococcus maanshanensis]|uniref:isochorismate synthase n=1 Tax=Rhodococcus maanshanensis TaxID=183556 RepID=UPI0022B5CAA0|nr:isochorismate synthase [Rhodococcus maanshanensis]MCZ4555525.1 isochorismate synthase [Rhodococcus maanshanensis]
MDGFLLSRADRTLRTSGSRERFHEIDAAAEALARRDIPLVVGALPFDPAGPAALTAPETARVTDGPWRPDSLPALPTVRLTEELPEPAEHLRRVARLIDRLRDGDLQKVVAARSVVLSAATPIDPWSLLARLVSRDHAGNGFGVDLSPAGDGYAGHALVGASPELLLRRAGSGVECFPLAGTAPRHADPDEDRAEGQRLLASAKNRSEHAFVTEWIRSVLDPVCTELTVPQSPRLIGTPAVWHLGTPIAGVLRDPAPSALELARLLHPTPAVGGTPTDGAIVAIRECEEPRRFYGGAAGWCDHDGDGEWVVAIRCAEIDADGLRARAWAGGGIVAASDPDSELAETSAKLRTLLGALGVDPEPAGRGA